MPLWLLLAIGAGSCTGQPTTMKEQPAANPLLCDPKQGVCEIPNAQAANEAAEMQSSTKPVKMVYFTDPICSSCWGIEPQLRKMKMEYGHAIDVEYRMGGLLPSWEGFNGGGITKPADVYHHWEEVSEYYGMPMLGDVWRDDPLPSSYPPSIAFKAAQMQDGEKALKFLRRLREFVFIEAKNITKWEYMEQAAVFAGLDPLRLKQDYDGPAKQLFEQDLLLARQMGVRGFPTIFLSDEHGNRSTIYGFKPYSEFEAALQRTVPGIKKQEQNNDVMVYFNDYKSLTAKELSVFNNITSEAAISELNRVSGEGKLTVITTKHGNLWRLKSQ